MPRWAAVDEAVSVARLKSRVPGPAEFVNAVLRSLTRAAGPAAGPALPVEAAAVRWSFPDWIAERWIARYGMRRGRGAHGRAERAPADDHPRQSPAHHARGPRRRGSATRSSPRRGPTALAPEGLIVERGSGRRAGPPSPAGWCTIQDEASMLIARLLAPEPGELVADACAAPGTKTTHLAELMDNRGQILAIDPQAARLRLRSSAAATRLGHRDRRAPRGHGRRRRGRFQGPLRSRARGRAVLEPGRAPPQPRREMARAQAADLGRLQEKQRGILLAAAVMARPGGRLVYATCSLEPEENEDVVRALLDSATRLAGGPPADFPVAPDRHGFVRCLPHVHGTDGFTAIRLRRAGG